MRKEYTFIDINTWNIEKNEGFDPFSLEMLTDWELCTNKYAFQ